MKCVNIAILSDVAINKHHHAHWSGYPIAQKTCRDIPANDELRIIVRITCEVSPQHNEPLYPEGSGRTVV
jgi:hypothetical protein